MASLIDLRSDTVTLPTPVMREAMARAEVGDDVYREDPTVNRLEEVAAAMMGKQAALFVPSGTMGNLIALLTHCPCGQEVILPDNAHSFLSEAGGAARLGHLPTRPLPTDRFGRLDPAAVEAAVRPDEFHHPRTGLICLENTHNRCGGTVLSAADIGAVAEIARRHGLPLHLDGARIFNAAIALGVPALELVREADSVQFCLSKGLSAPVGSMLTGPAPFMAEARRFRKMLGGGMRQAGILAAAGIVALEQMIDRLAEDHANARRLARSLAGLPGVQVDLETVQTNMVAFNLTEPAPPAAELVGRLKAEGVLVSAFGPRRIRAVTHYGIEAADIDRVVQAAARVLNTGVRV